MPTPPKKTRSTNSPRPGKSLSHRLQPPQPQPATPSASSARISRRASDSLRRGHLWVYASEIEELHAPKDDPPALIAVADNRGIPLGTALYSPSSQIALRLVSREIISESEWHNLLTQRLREAIARRAPLLNENNNAARLVFSEADNLPGLVLDKYAGIVILQLLAKGLDNEATRGAIVETLADALDGETLTIWERPDPRIRQLEGLSAPSTTPLYHRGPSQPESSALFRINGLSFHFDALSGQKTGAFLDQRENYAAAARWARARNLRRALDVCTYQGGFALHLAQAGCQVTAVDQSRASLEVAEQNLALNREQGHLAAGTEIEWLEADAFDLLRDWASQHLASRRSKDAQASQDSLAGSAQAEPWQMIVLDPPAFAKSKRAVEGALRGYKELNLRALQLLAPGGLLITCSCSHHVSLADLESAVASAASDAGRRVTLLERRGAALDHPAVLNLPETEYLKCLILSVD
ncbi:MAG TPA: class I SAM-dependent rRNA methyltransferase [Acidobacteriaceae bacterium]